VMSRAEMEDVTIANLMRMVVLKTTKIVVVASCKFNNKYALEPRLYLVS
jgi:hypothetical protein